MPKVDGGPKELNSILESAFMSCMKDGKHKEERCHKIAWGAAKNAGWKKDMHGKWTKQSSRRK